MENEGGEKDKGAMRYGLRRLVQSKHAMKGVMLCTFVMKSKGEVSHKVDFSLEYEFSVSIFYLILWEPTNTSHL